MTVEADPEQIAIAGAGIAGLSAAIALKLAGFPVHIFERESSPLPIGAGLQLGPSATRILAQWGVALPITVCEPETLELRNARTGKLLKTIPLGDPARRRYGAPYVTLLRAELHAALLARSTELECPIAFNCSPIPLVDKDGLTTEVDGAKVRSAALIGADGLHSGIRDLLPLSPKPAYTQTTAWRSVLPGRAVPAPFRQSIIVWMGSGAHLVHYPVSAGAALNAVLVIEEDWRTAGLCDGRAAPSLTALMRRLGGWAEFAQAIVAASDDWQPWPIYRVPPSDGGRGRMQLIGDAWHAMPPFLASGGVMAIEDAASLAGSFSEKGEPLSALEHFRTKRSARVWRVSSRSSRMGRIYHFPRPFDSIRDAIIRATPSELLLAGNDWLYGRES